MESIMPIHTNLSEIVAPYAGILLDAYGVFWNGNARGLFPGAKELMKRLVKANKKIGILSNSTQLAEKELLKFEKHGLYLNEHFHFLLTSGEVAKKVLTDQQLPFTLNHQKYGLFCATHPSYSSHLALFEHSPYKLTDTLSEADFIYISIPHIEGEDQEDPASFELQIQNLKQYNLPMLCANPDRFAHEGDPPRAVVRQGSIAALYEKMGGTVFYIGKPGKLLYDQAMEKFKSCQIFNKKDVLMVGDTPETDIQGACASGIDSALILETGIAASRIEKTSLDEFLSSLSSIDKPTYLIKKMADYATF